MRARETVRRLVGIQKWETSERLTRRRKRNVGETRTRGGGESGERRGGVATIERGGESCERYVLVVVNFCLFVRLFLESSKQRD